MRTAAITVLLLAVGLGQVVAKSPGAQKPTSPRPPKAATTTHGPKAAAPAVKGTAVKGPKGPTSTGRTSQGGTRGTGAVKTTTRPPAGKSASGSGTSVRGTASSSSKAPKSTTHAAPTQSGASTTTTLGPNVPKNPKLQERLQARLPAGVTLNEAAAHFKNQGQFVAAMHVSQNLGIPFLELKARMVSDGLSLGQAIQALRPTVDGMTEARRAEQLAATDLR